MDLVLGVRTDPGRRRSNNEDRLLTQVLGESDGPAGHLLAVADGVGGGPSGEVASETAVSTLRSSFCRLKLEAPAKRLAEAMQSANGAVHDLAQSSLDNQGMASTLVAAAVIGSSLYIGNVGDSRAYLIRGGVAVRLTTDHTLAEEFVLVGKMTEEEASHSRQRHLLTRSLGGQPDVEVDVFGPHILEAGDVLLLCSDGLYGVVPDPQLAEICSEYSPQVAADRLVELANENGGPDNITLIVARAVMS